MNQCKNCGGDFDGNYCPNCGQRYIDKFTWRYAFELFMDSIEFERGLLYNIKELFLRPGSSVKQYINGKTKPYLNAITFFIIGFTFYGITNWLVHDVASTGIDNSYMNFLVGFVFILTFIIYIPIVLLVSARKYSVLESCLISFLLFGEMSILFTLLTFPFKLLNVSWGLPIGMIISILYFIWFQISFYKKNFIKVLLSIVSTGIIMPLSVVLIENSQFNIIELRGILNVKSPLENELEYDKYLTKILDSLIPDEENLGEGVRDVCTSDFGLTTYNYVDSIKSEIVKWSGGIDENGDYNGILDPTFFETHPVSELNQTIGKYEEKLFNCKCEVEAIFISNFNSEKLVGIRMIRSLNILTQLQIDILISNKNCTIKYFSSNPEQ